MLVHVDALTRFVTVFACFYLQIPVVLVEAGLRILMFIHHIQRSLIGKRSISFHNIILSLRLYKKKA